MFEERKDDIINAINASNASMTPYLLARNIAKITGMVPGVDFSYISGIKPLVVVVGRGRGEGIMNSMPITSEEIRQGREQFTREEPALIEEELGHNSRNVFHSFIDHRCQ